MSKPQLSPSEVIRQAFPGLLLKEARDMANTGAIKNYAEGKILCQEGAQERIFYILLNGRVEVTKVVDMTEVRLLKNLDPGDFFGEMALIQNAPRAATVRTITPVTVLEINKEDFNQLLQNNNVISMAMVREVSRRLRENDDMAIGDLRVKARELADAYQQLAEMEYARREFLTTIAHELRTPLMAAAGYLQAIRMGMMSGELLPGALETVTRNMQEITALVNDILFLQEMELIFSDFQGVDIGAVVTAVGEQQRAHAQQSNVALKLSIGPGLPSILGDAKSLQRALTAVVDNAIKFSPEGGEVEVNVIYQTPEVIVTVEDHGVGIPEDAKPRIFERFFRLDTVSGHLFRGIGLGLSIAREVIEQHGGKIEVESQLGQGSKFTICLKLDGGKKPKT